MITHSMTYCSPYLTSLEMWKPYFHAGGDQDRLCLKEGHKMRETRGFMKDFIAGSFGFGSVCCCGGLGFFSRKCLLGNVLSLEHVSEMVDKCLGAFF